MQATATEAKFRIGDEVEFTHQGEQRTGKVAGKEFVEAPYRGRSFGWYLTIDVGAYQLIEVHERALVNV